MTEKKGEAPSVLYCRINELEAYVNVLRKRINYLEEEIEKIRIHRGHEHEATEL